MQYAKQKCGNNVFEMYCFPLMIIFVAIMLRLQFLLISDFSIMMSILRWIIQSYDQLFWFMSLTSYCDDFEIWFYKHVCFIIVRLFLFQFFTLSSIGRSPLQWQYLGVKFKMLKCRKRNNKLFQVSCFMNNSGVKWREWDPALLFMKLLLL